MLSIQIDNQPLDLPNDFSISLNLKSPVFNDVGDYSFPFKVPSTPRNMSILGWKNRLSSTRSIFEIYQGSIRWNGIVLFSGQINVKTASDSSFEGTLYINNGNFNYEVKNILLNRLDFGGKTFVSDVEAMSYFNWSYFQSYPECDFSMPEIANADFRDPPATNPELLSYNHIFPNGLLHEMTTDGLSRTILVPFLYLKFVLDKLGEIFGYTIQDEFFNSTTELSNLVIYNSVNISERLFGLYRMFFSQLLPEIKVIDFLSGLEKWFNCSFHVDTNKKVIRIFSNKNVLLHSEVVEFSKDILSISQEIPEQITSFRFISTPDSGDKRYQEILTAEGGITTLIHGAYQSFSDVLYLPFTEIGDIVYIIDTNSWWQFAINGFSFMTEWIQLPNAPTLIDKLYYKWGDEKNKYETIFSTLADPFGIGVCGNLESESSKITSRLFFVAFNHQTWEDPLRLRGMVDNGTFSLKYYGTDGLFNLYWKDWVNWIIDNRKSVKIEKQMDFIDLKNLDFTSRYRINGINYLISQISVTLNKFTIKSAQLTCFTAP